MILKLKNISDVEAVKNASDYYVRIKIMFGDWDRKRDPSCCWSSGTTENNTLVEIRLKEHNGVICGITIVSMPKIHRKNICIKNKNIVTKAGIPSFETNAWYEEQKHINDNIYVKGYYIRENKDFDVYAGESSVSIVFSYNEIKLKVINGPIVFGFDKDNFLCFIQMTGMKLNEEGFLEEIKQKCMNFTVVR